MVTFNKGILKGKLCFMSFVSETLSQDRGLQHQFQLL